MHSYPSRKSAPALYPDDSSISGSDSEIESTRSLTFADDAADLIRRIAMEDPSALAALYDRFSVPLYSMAVKMLESEAEASEVLKDVFLSVWAKAKDFPDARFSMFGWLVSHVRQSALDRIRSRPRGSIPAACLGELATSNASAHACAEINSQGGDKKDRFLSAFGRLAEGQQQVLRLAFFEGLTPAEIAGRLEESTDTVRRWAVQGMKRLKAC